MLRNPDFAAVPALVAPASAGAREFFRRTLDFRRASAGSFVRLPHRAPPLARRGQVTVLGLMLLALLALAGFALSTSGTTDYAQTARAIAAGRAEEISRSAVEEAVLRVRDAVDPGDPGAAWKERLLDALDRAIETSRGSSDPEAYRGVELTVDLAPALTATRAALGANSGATLVEATAHLYGFHPIVYPSAEGFSSTRAYYREKVFGDDARDPVPRDFQGYLTLQVVVAAKSGGYSVTRQFTGTHDVKVLDVTPPAREFTLFSYGPPPDARYVYSDLNAGGVLAAFPKDVGRVFVRGPLFLDVEDASDPASFGGPLRAEPSVAYPEFTKRDWHGWAAIPGGRAVRMPNFIMAPGELFDTIGRLIGGAGMAAFHHPPQRPLHEMPALGRIKIPIVDMSLPGVFLLGIAPAIALGSLGGFVGLYQPLPPEEQIAVALNWAYLTGTVPRGKQTFSITGLPPDRLGASTGAEPSIQMYRGVLVKADGTPKPRPYEGGLDLPRSGYADGQGAVEDQDSILPEPFFGANNRDDRETELARHDHGIYGVYRIATYDRFIYATIDIGALLAAIPGVNVVAGPIVGALRAAGMMITLVPLHYKINGPKELTGLTAPEVDSKEWARYFFAPYGLHFDSGLNQNIWGELASDVAAAVMTMMLDKMMNWLVFGKLFGKSADPAAIAASDKVGDKLSQKVSSVFTGVGRDGAKTHAMLQLLAKKVGGSALAGASREAIQLVLVRKLLTETMKGAIGAGVFTATALAMNQVRKALLGNRLKGRSLGSALSKSPLEEDFTRAFPKGFYPPKYRPWFRAATRVYETFEDYLADQGSGELNVDGIVLIRKLDYDGGNRVFTYRGRGVIAAVGDEGDRPRLNIRLRRADPSSHLTLAYENLAPAEGSAPPQLELGTDFEGSIYSTNGVRPAGSLARIRGNLVTFHLNKSRVPADSAVRVYHDTALLPPARDKHSRKDWWVLSVSPLLAGGAVAGR